VNRKSSIWVAAALVAGLLIGLFGFQWLARTSAGAKPAQAEPATDTRADWCAEHRVPESECTKCHQSLIPAFKAKSDWCAEHDLPESHCRLCNPNLKFPQEVSSADPLSTSTGAISFEGNIETSESKVTDWCSEHRVPESECTKCNPDLISVFKEKGDWCNEHQLPESHDRICSPSLTFAQEPRAANPPDEFIPPSVFFAKNASTCATDGAIIQFASVETAARAGLALAPAISVSETSSAEAPAEILFDEAKAYAVTTVVPASVVRWLVQPGELVSADQAIAELESPEIPRLKADYLEAVTEARLKELEHNRTDSLNSRGLISAAEYQQISSAYETAQAHLAGARGLLQSCGLTDSDLELLKSSRSITPRWLLRVSRHGSLLERKATLGTLLSAGSSIALVGDPSALWIEAHVRESDLTLFQHARTVEFASDAGTLDRVSGKIIWVAQYIDPQTRSATVRAEVIGNATELKAHLFGRMYLPVSADSRTVAVPCDAVQWEGCCNVVFVQEATDRFRPHKVTITRGDRGYYNVSSGLQAGDVVVVEGSYMLKTELRKGSLGAGCCDVAPKS
jgi:cobalt-zinc-cadmium efflux system membrane fusion protein